MILTHVQTTSLLKYTDRLTLYADLTTILSNSWVSSVPVTSTTTDASIAASLSSRRRHEILVNRSQPFCSFLHVSSHNICYKSQVTSSISRPDFSAWPEKIQKRKRVKSKRQVRQTERERERKTKEKWGKKQKREKEANDRKRERKKDRGRKKRWVWTKRNGFRETSKSVSTLFFLFLLLWIYIQRLPFTFSPFLFHFLFFLHSLISIFSATFFFFQITRDTWFQDQDQRRATHTISEHTLIPSLLGSKSNFLLYKSIHQHRFLSNITLRVDSSSFSFFHSLPSFVLLFLSFSFFHSLPSLSFLFSHSSISTLTLVQRSFLHPISTSSLTFAWEESTRGMTRWWRRGRAKKREIEGGRERQKPRKREKRQSGESWTVIVSLESFSPRFIKQ